MVSDDPESFADLDGHDSIFDNIISAVGGDRRNPGPTVVQMLVGGAKGLANLAISLTNTVTSSFDAVAGIKPGGEILPSGTIPEIPLSNAAQELGAVAATTLTTAAVSGLAEPGAGAGVQANRASGLAFEGKAIESEGLTKNTTPMEAPDPKTGQAGTTIPDAMRSNGQTVDAKNVKTLSDSPQLRRQSMISAKSGQKAQVLVNKNNIQKVSPTVQKRMDIKKIDP
jgi:hypothetical protein